MIRQVQGASFPRSGHHLLEQALRLYFGCAWSYCEQYKCCNEYPCANDARFSKSHDFDLTNRIKPDGLYLVQNREPLPALMSWYEAEVCRGVLDDTAATWAAWARKQAEFYRAWSAKWGKVAGCHIRYGALTKMPVPSLAVAVCHFAPGVDVNIERLEQIVKVLGVGPSIRRVEDFTYYGDEQSRAVIAEITGVGV